jgi:hypothetical protein
MGQIVFQTLSQKYPAQKGLAQWLKWWKACLVSGDACSSNLSTAKKQKTFRKIKFKIFPQCSISNNKDKSYKPVWLRNAMLQSHK